MSDRERWVLVAGLVAGLVLGTASWWLWLLSIRVAVAL